jgi:hypothetical protein
MRLLDKFDALAGISQLFDELVEWMYPKVRDVRGDSGWRRRGRSVCDAIGAAVYDDELGGG